jgi:chemotaxis protein CheD
LKDAIATRATQVVGVADLKVGRNSGILITRALGSCLGVTVYDPVTRAGGLLHAMLPVSRINPEKARANPPMFVDTGLPALLESVYALGGVRSRLEVRAVGCAGPIQAAEVFKIGERNYEVLKRLVSACDLVIAAEDVGGSASRTVQIDLETGCVKVRSAGGEREL